ncbi:MAG: hypothetical protein QME92_01330 [Bacillota bacterium]|nr:hypothetical protein [Bacillota bacterium]
MPRTSDECGIAPVGATTLHALVGPAASSAVREAAFVRMPALLGVSPAAYLPYAFLCWTLPVVSVAWILLREATYAPHLAEAHRQ